jgi:hypothetical protein
LTESRRPQALVFSYHKSGTTLFDRIMHKVAARLGLTIRVHYGMAYNIDRGADIVLLPHSLLGFELARDYRGVRIIRDPRDIWVSGYLYHRHTAEGWCVSANFDPMPPIAYPRVDFSMLHRPERWCHGAPDSDRFRSRPRDSRSMRAGIASTSSLHTARSQRQCSCREWSGSRRRRRR